MRDDTKQELERLERQLLQQEQAHQSENALLEDLKEILGEEKEEVTPAFDDPQTIHAPKKPMVFANYANNYGRKQPKTDKKEVAGKKKPEKLTLGLLITACLLTLGIIGVLMYWLLFLLR